MAIDDYNRIKFAILAYYYGILKGKYLFNQEEYEATISRQSIRDSYYYEIIDMMLEEGLVKNIEVRHHFGGDAFFNHSIADMKITASGINYLEENSLMKKIKEESLRGIGFITEIVKMVLL